MASLSFSVFKDLDFVSVHKNAKRELYPISSHLDQISLVKNIFTCKSHWEVRLASTPDHFSVSDCKWVQLQSHELKGFSLGNLVFPLSLKTNSCIDHLPEADMYQVIDR